ncbi:hypothetical protein [Ligilactobacillus aviarius]|uniref:hypothetical protein n=1 Tax=Ligilactobacillus aviarius TaxID=1606 RepID=UPI0024B947F5|nr:hypothetical protein [Ligilactobacillus aviarius]
MERRLKNESKKISNGYRVTIMVFFIITFLGLVYLFLKEKYFYLQLKNFKSMLESSIDFLSIIIGFYSAFIGIVIAVKESTSFKELDKITVKHFILFSICISFLTLVMSFLLQVFVCYKSLWWLVYLWIMFFVLAIVCAFLTILLTLLSVFGDDSIPKEEEKS